MSCPADLMPWARPFFKVELKEKTFGASLINMAARRKKKTRLNHWSLQYFVFLFLFGSITHWQLDDSVHIFHLLCLHIFSHFSFLNSLFVSSPTLCTKPKVRDKRSELTDGAEFGRGRDMMDLELAICHRRGEEAEREGRAREAEWSCAERVLKLRGECEERNWLTRRKGVKSKSKRGSVWNEESAVEQKQ